MPSRRFCGATIALAAAIAACSGAPRASAPSLGNPTTSTTSGRTRTTDACFAATRSHARLTSPQPRHVESRFALSPTPNYAVLDSPGAARPAVSADVAWSTLSRGWYSGGRDAQLLLGYYSALLPMTSGTPMNTHVLAWVLIGRHVVVPSHFTSGCGFEDAYSVLDAQRGKPITTVVQPSSDSGA